MRRISAMLLMCLLPAHTLVFAGEPAISAPDDLAFQQTRLASTGGVLMAAAVREATRLARLNRAALTAQAGGSQGSSGSGSAGRAVLLGAVIGAVAGATFTAAGASCAYRTIPSCTIDKKRLSLLGAGIGTGVGALIGLAIKH